MLSFHYFFCESNELFTFVTEMHGMFIVTHVHEKLHALPFRSKNKKKNETRIGNGRRETVKSTLVHYAN